MDARTDHDWQPDDSIPYKVRQGLPLLLEAHDYAEDLCQDVWNFSVEIGDLREAGLGNSDLRWLICKQYVEHAREITMPGSNERAFQRRGTLTFDKRTAFVLTDAGVQVAQKVARQAAASGNGRPGANVSADGSPDDSPCTPPHPALAVKSPKWDRDRHELRVGDSLVKVFKLPSPVQETILAAFEEDDWPARIDDPLPPHPDLIPKQRLHDAIKGLNRNQRKRLIRFKGDGTGEGILWEFVTSGAAKGPCENGSTRE